ncbi:metallophosphoesterase [Halomonas aquamarina]|uniref:Metallophosphoesterase n=1 Tax=Vreelandella aquamarina TaxID=77097 RepID=A0ACC5VS63_9GAMM|nr:metallophosphoesterase [Halomonas aquamarina]MBZ5486983.1 metallophosphoesterase [Halomonas aquamarina]
MLIAHLSDLHLYTQRSETGQAPRDICLVVERIARDLLSLAPRPDLVVISGDLADGGTEEDYRQIRELLEPLPMPVLAVPGNHDRREAMRCVLGERLAGLQEGEFLHSRVDMSGVTLLGLDSVVAGRPEGALCGKRLDWLERELEKTQPLVFLVMHHPPFSTGNPHWDAYSLIEGRERFTAIIDASPKRILCGHIHQPLHIHWGAHYGAIAGSPAFQYHLVPGSTAAPTESQVSYSYPLHYCQPDGSVLVHLRHIM